jgi:hypothetical protein
MIELTETGLKKNVVMGPFNLTRMEPYADCIIEPTNSVEGVYGRLYRSSHRSFFILDEYDFFERNFDVTGDVPNLIHAKFVQFKLGVDPYVYDASELQYMVPKIIRLLYVVHWHYGSLNVITAINGMKHVFFIQSNDHLNVKNDEALKSEFVPYPAYTAWMLQDIQRIKSVFFVKNNPLMTVYREYNLRRSLYRLFRQSLIDSKGMKNIKFLMKISFDDFEYLEKFSLNLQYQIGKAKSSINLSVDGIIRSPTIVHVVGFEIHRVDLLFDLIGSDFFLFSNL